MVEAIDSYSPDGGTVFNDTFADGCEPPARLYIGDVEVPIVGSTDGDGGITVKERKSGDANITKTARCHIPYQWGGESVIDAVGGFEEIGKDPVRIDLKDRASGEYGVVMHGPIASVGPSESINGTFHLRVHDWANVLDEISASQSFDGMTTIYDFMGYVKRRVNEHDLFSQFDEIPIVAESEQDEITDISGNSGDEVFSEQENEDGFYLLKNEVHFTSNRHTLTDVMDFVAQHSNLRWYMEYDEELNAPKIVWANNTPPYHIEGKRMYEETSLGDMQMYENNALFQIGPVSSLKVNGATGGPLSSISQGEYVTAVAHHTEIQDRIGKNNSPPEVSVNVQEVEGVEKQARSRLKERIDGATGGEMICFPSPLARPYATISAEPACNGELDIALPEIEYEIEEVIHDIKPVTQGDADGCFTTLRCGVKATDEDIVVESETVKE